MGFQADAFQGDGFQTTAPEQEPETIKNYGIFRRYLYPDLEEEEIILALWTLL
jgi:hypothetical protein